MKWFLGLGWAVAARLPRPLQLRRWLREKTRGVNCQHQWHFIGWRPEFTGARRVYQCRKCLRCKVK